MALVREVKGLYLEATPIEWKTSTAPMAEEGTKEVVASRSGKRRRGANRDDNLDWILKKGFGDKIERFAEEFIHLQVHVASVPRCSADRREDGPRSFNVKHQGAKELGTAQRGHGVWYESTGSSSGN